jgi:hypothetical protein
MHNAKKKKPYVSKQKNGMTKQAYIHLQTYTKLLTHTIWIISHIKNDVKKRRIMQSMWNIILKSIYFLQKKYFNGIHNDNMS